MTAVTAKPVVLVTSRSFGSGDRDLVAELTDHGTEVVRGSTDHEPDALREPLATAVAWIAGTAPIGADLLTSAPHLRIVARYGVGYDAVDLAAAAEHGVLVTNTPGANSEAVADATIALLLAALRGVVVGDRDVRAGRWAARPGRELSGLTVGIVGFGRIGRGVAKRLSGWGCRLLVVDPYVDAADLPDGVHAVDPTDLPAAADVITLHAPGGELLVDAAWLARKPSGLLLVNTARASLVDEAALAAALRAGRVSAYAADTLDDEGGTPPHSPLLADDLADRVVLTPHRAAQTVEAVDRMGASAVEAVLDVLAGRRPQNLVSAPIARGGP